MELNDINARQLLESLQEGVVVHNASTEILYANPKALELLRLTEQQALGKDALDPEWRFIDAEHKVMTHQDFPVNRVLAEKKALSNLEVGICDSSSEKITWVLCNAFPQFGQDGEIEKIIVGFLDISTKKTEIPFEAIIANANDVILVTEAGSIEGDGPKIVYVNNAFCDLTGYTPSEVIGKTPRILQGKETSSKTKSDIREALIKKEPIRTSILNYSKKGTPYWLDMNIFPLENGLGEVAYFAAVERDITHQIEKENQLQDLATKDQLTGLLNRRGFFELIKKEQSNWTSKSRSTLALIDIDFFKKINDSFGHECGDKALKCLAENFRLMFREADLICRYGGEEFVLVLLNADLETGEKKIESFREKIAATPLHIEYNKSITITVSIGITEINADSTTIESALNKADEALYKAKLSGRNKSIVGH